MYGGVPRDTHLSKHGLFRWSHDNDRSFLMTCKAAYREAIRPFCSACMVTIENLNDRFIEDWVTTDSVFWRLLDTVATDIPFSDDEALQKLVTRTRLKKITITILEFNGSKVSMTSQDASDIINHKKSFTGLEKELIYKLRGDIAFRSVEKCRSDSSFNAIVTFNCFLTKRVRYIDTGAKWEWDWVSLQHP